MSVGRKARLARLAPRIIKPVWPDPERLRRRLQRHIEFCLLLRETLQQLNVDAAAVAMLCTQDEAAAELTSLGHAIPDRVTPGNWRATYLRCAEALPPDAARDVGIEPPPHDDDPRMTYLAKLDRMVRSYLNDASIDFSGDSLMQVFAWCAARLMERAPAGRAETAELPEQKRDGAAGTEAVCC
jgi:hypothetical protein